MTVSAHQPPLDRDAERLLSSLAGVISARVVASHTGHLLEIHVLATTGLHPKQVVRNVESALRAGLGIQIDRRIVSVAQLQPDLGAATGATGAAYPPRVAADGAGSGAAQADRSSRLTGAPVLAGAGERARVEFIDYTVHCRASRHAVCRVLLRYEGQDVTGTGERPDTPQGRAEAAALALFAALGQLRGAADVAFEGLARVAAHGRTYVIVTARTVNGRRSIALNGVAPVGRSAEEAAILASLQAANRWVDLPLEAR